MHASVEPQGREMNGPSELNDAANRTFQVWKEQEHKNKSGNFVSYGDTSEIELLITQKSK